jgi:hypothetical protein
MAENDFSQPVIGVSMDGTGYGTDGTIWGGEILTADYHGFARSASIRPFIQVGGDASSTDGWRIAVSMLHSIGKEWNNGEFYIDQSHYYTYREDTVYFFNDNIFGNVKYAKETNNTILEFSDFDWSREFTKADLKTGDVVLRRNGYVEIVNRDMEMFINKDSWMNFDTLSDDLREMGDSEWDIIAVRRPEQKHHCQFIAFDKELGTLVYERKEPEEMTLAEVCKLLGKEIKIIP